jgi:hypothetical protein
MYLKMSLSKINDLPVYTTTIPSTKEKAKFRPFLVKEERALLTAAESEDAETMYASLESVVKNCLITDHKRLTTFDLEYLFIQIRTKSVGEFSDLIFNCPSCKEPNEETVDLRKVDVFYHPEHTNKIQLSDTINVKMKYPTIEEVLSIQSAKNAEEAKLLMVKCCIELVSKDDDVYVISEEEDVEILGFIDTLTSSQYGKLKSFVDTIPSTILSHKWKCKHCGAEHTRELKGIFSFF